MAEQFAALAESDGSEPQLHIADYWLIVLKRRRLVLLCMTLFLCGGVALTLLTKPAYRATAVVDLVKQLSNPLGFGDRRGEAPENDFLESQIQLMQSREIGARVVRRLNLLADATFNPKHYFDYLAAPRGKGRQPSEDEIIRAAIGIQGSLEPTSIRGTTLVQITAKAGSGKLAADIANAVADSFIEWSAESRYRMMGQSSQFLTAQIEQAKAEIDAKEKDLLAYGRQKDLITADPQGNAALQKLDLLNRDLSAATADRLDKETRYQEVQSTPPEALADAASAGAIAQQLADLQRMEREYSDKLSVYKPEWPAMQQLKSQIEQARKSLDTLKTDAAARAVGAARTEYLTALRKEQNLKTLAKSQRTEALSQGSDAIEYRNLRVEIDTKRALLDSLLKEQGETELASRLAGDQITNVRVVDRALPPRRPFKPSLKMNLLLGGFLGLATGVGLAFLLSHLDRSLRTPEQVEQYLHLPALGIIPAVGSLEADGKPKRRPFGRWRGAAARTDEKAAIELLPHTEPRSAVAEAYRAFRAALLLSRAGGVRTITVTSSFPDEGKTATAVNLAVVLAQLGRRVLLVDADLHKSRIHEVFQVSNRTGLVSVLAENLEPSRAIIKTNYAGVFVVPAGPETPNPSGLLSSDAMAKFMELAATNFDHVIVDSPPVLLVSDTLVFAQQTDGVLLCVRGGLTPREQVVRARDRILRTGASILGVLINALEPESHGYYYKTYGYEYGGERREAEGSSEPRAAQGS